MTVRPSILALCTFGVACAYYNGLYNANRLADEARQAESQGRRGEARSLWLQAAAKADSVASRYPDSEYLDDAQLMSGLAHSRVGDCEAAMPPLADAIQSSPDASIVDRARMLLGECQLELAQYDSVPATVDPIVHHQDRRIAARARTLRGRAVLAAGDPQSALRDLEDTQDSVARFDLAAALIGANQFDRAGDLLRWAIEDDSDNDRWIALIDRLGQEAPGRAADLVDEWVESDELDAGQVARLLMDDGDRWAHHKVAARASARYTEAIEAAGNSPVSEDARFRLAELRLEHSADLTSLSAIAEDFARLSARRAVQYAGILRRVVASLEDPQADDLGLFQLAEVVRDSLGAVNLAGAIFRRLVSENPHSVIGPKALLAVAMLQPEKADSIRAVLERDYPESPYTQIVTGGAGAGFTAVEDSLRRAARRDTLRRRRR